MSARKENQDDAETLEPGSGLFSESGERANPFIRLEIYLLSTYSMQGTVLDAVDTTENKTTKLCPNMIYIVVSVQPKGSTI